MHVCWWRLIVAMVALPLVAGVVIILMCFVCCPLLWKEIPNTEQSDYYRTPLYVVGVLALWVLFAIGIFFLWWRRKPKVIVDDSTEVIVDEPIKVIFDEPIKVIFDEPAKVIVDEPAKVIVDEPAKVIVDEPAKVIVDEPAKVIVDETTLLPAAVA
ncbi:uncharacterized protein LOC126427120 isoform X3 [Schistocerca serialis cubense]|uniref:uncharacterized protein LOC126427120 isoform X3 n=1 Tax=Schistocerca serialis cubense TaxID=2023355 RepID=UPI00214EF220|nr:uncharacterized protein LOC126427120 isoform X3 [Schistocerca serialis cubense]